MNKISAAQTRLLSTPEVSKRTGIPANQIRSLIEAGKIKAIDISTGQKRPLWKVPEHALQEFLTPKRARKKRD